MKGKMPADGLSPLWIPGKCDSSREKWTYGIAGMNTQFESEGRGTCEDERYVKSATYFNFLWVFLSYLKNKKNKTEILSWLVPTCVRTPLHNNNSHVGFHSKNISPVREKPQHCHESNNGRLDKCRCGTAWKCSTLWQAVPQLDHYVTTGWTSVSWTEKKNLVLSVCVHLYVCALNALWGAW